MEKIGINPPDLHPPANNAYSHAIRSGKLLFIAGQVSMDAQGNVVGPNDIRAQTKQVFENLKTVLRASGATFSNIVYWTAYMVDMKKNFAGYAEVRTQYLAAENPKPATALVEVSGLSAPGLVFEIQAIAVLD